MQSPLFTRYLILPKSYIQKAIPPVKCSRDHMFALDTQSAFWNAPYTKDHHDVKHRTDGQLLQDAWEFVSKFEVNCFLCCCSQPEG